MAIKNKRLKFLRGSTYTFDVSDSALATNPLKFTADSGSTEYTSGITLTGTQGQSGASLQFVVDSGTPNNLNYFGDSSSLRMGNHILVPGTVGTLGDISSASGSLGMQVGSTNSQWFEFNGDGTALFVHHSGSGGNAPAGYLLRKYTLSTPYDLTTATYSNDEYYGSGNDYEGKFSGDGMKFYYDSGTLWMHNLTTAFTPSNQITGSPNADGSGPSGESFCFKADGTVLYTLAKSNTPNGVVQWDLSTAWDITTNSLQGGQIAGNNFDYSSQMTGASNIEMNSTGTKFYIYTRYSTITGAPIAIVEYDMTTPWDITTGTYNGKYLNVGSDGFQSAERISFRLENDRQIFVKGPNSNHSGNDAIYQYTIPYVSTSSGGGTSSTDYADSSLSESFFLNAVKAYDSDVGTNTYSAFSTALTSRFSDPESLTTNGEYTCVAEHGLMLEHTGPGSTGTAKLSGAGWAWIIRNRDGALMKSWNGLIRDYDHTNLDEEEFNYLNTDMQYSKYHTANWGCSVASNEKYLFVASGYRPSSSSVPNRNFSDDRAFIFVYDFKPPFALRKVIKCEDFNTTDVAHSSSTGYRGGGSGWTEHEITAGEDWLIVPAAYANYYGNSTSGGRLTYWDISDSDPSNWSSTPDAVIQNPINVVNTPTQTWNGTLYANNQFGSGGAVIRHNKLTTGHSIHRYTYTKSGNSFSLNTSTVVGPYKNYSRPPYLAWTNDSSSPKFLQFNYGTAGSSTTRQIQLIDPSNSHNADWTYDLNAVSGSGYPFGMRHLTVGKDVKTELFSYGDAYRGGDGKSGQIRFVKASDRSEVFNLDNPFTRDSDGLYFGDNYAHHAIESDGSNRYSLVSWGEPDDVDNKDIYSFWELKWDSDLSQLYLDTNPPGVGFFAQVRNPSISSTITGNANTNYTAYGIAQSSDKSYYIVGRNVSGQYQAMLLKFDKEGNFEWIRGFGSNGNSSTTTSWSPGGVICDPSDGKPIVYGKEYGYGKNQGQQYPAGFIMKFNKDGTRDYSKIMKFNNMPSTFPNNARTDFVTTNKDSYGNFWSIWDYDQINDQINGANYYRDVVALTRWNPSGTLSGVYFLRPGTGSGGSNSDFKNKGRIEPRGLLVDGTNLYVTSETSDGDKEAAIQKLTISSSSAMPAWAWSKSHAYGSGSTSSWDPAGSYPRFKFVCVDPADNNPILQGNVNDGTGTNGNQFSGWRTVIAKINASNGNIIWGKVLDGSNNASSGTWTQANTEVALHNTNYLIVASNVDDGSSPTHMRMFCRLVNISDGTTSKIYEVNSTGTAPGGSNWQYGINYFKIDTMITDADGCAVLTMNLNGGLDWYPTILKFPKVFDYWSSTLGTNGYGNIELTEVTSSYTDEDMTFSYVPSSDPITFGSLYGNFSGNFSIVNYGGGTYGDGFYTPTTDSDWNEKISITNPTTLPWNGSRVLATGGNSPAETYSYSNVIQYFDITTLGDAQDFGDLTEIKNGVCAVGNGGRCVIMAGQGRTSTQTPPGSGRNLDEMEYVSFATPANAVSFGLLGTGVHDAAAGSNGTRGIIGGGDAGTSSATDVIQYITIDTAGGSSSFGNLTAETHMGMSTNDDTYLGFLEGYTSSGGFGYRNTNTWVTMDTLGNSVNQGSFTYGIGNGGKGIVSDNTYGVVFGGNEDYTSGGTSWNNNIYYLTIATKSDASDFGDCITSLGHAGQASYAQTKRGVSIGGFYNPGTVTIDTISHIVIDTPGNASDFGDLTQATEYSYGVSGNAA